MVKFLLFPIPCPSGCTRLVPKTLGQHTTLRFDPHPPCPGVEVRSYRPPSTGVASPSGRWHLGRAGGECPPRRRSFPGDLGPCQSCLLPSLDFSFSRPGLFWDFWAGADRRASTCPTSSPLLKGQEERAPILTPWDVPLLPTNPSSLVQKLLQSCSVTFFAPRMSNGACLWTAKRGCSPNRGEAVRCGSTSIIPNSPRPFPRPCR